MTSWLNDKAQGVDPKCPGLYSDKDGNIFFIFKVEPQEETEEWHGVCVYSITSKIRIGEEWVFVAPERDLKSYLGYVTIHT